MKFKIIEIKQGGGNIKVAISHKDCMREVFGLPIEFAENNKFIEEIKRILKEREKVKKVKIDESLIGKEIKV